MTGTKTAAVPTAPGKSHQRRAPRSAQKPLQDNSTLASVQAAFEIFERQSRKLETAYRGLELDLAQSNANLHEKNRELTARNTELREVSSRLESVIESLTDGLLVIGLDGHVERSNAAATRMIEGGIPDGARFTDVIRMKDAELFLNRVLQDGIPVPDQSWTIRKAESGGCCLLFSLAPVTAPDGSILGAICNLRDVTELRRLEKRLQSQERLAALGEMAASVAHEIRNPLGTIEGFARLLRRDLEAMPAPLRLAEKIVAGAQNLNYVITNLLTYARPMRLIISDEPLSSLFESCRDTLQDRASRAGVTLSIDPPPAGTMLRADHRQLTQALLNLGINAIEACEPEGVVRVWATTNFHSVILHVSDSGCGMSPELITKMFDPFFTSKEGGTGLGLSLTRKISDMHGGDISVTSVPGKGSEFTIELSKTGVSE